MAEQLKETLSPVSAKAFPFVVGVSGPTAKADCAILFTFLVPEMINTLNDTEYTYKDTYPPDIFQNHDVYMNVLSLYVLFVLSLL